MVLLKTNKGNIHTSFCIPIMTTVLTFCSQIIRQKSFNVFFKGPTKEKEDSSRLTKRLDKNLQMVK